MIQFSLLFFFFLPFCLILSTSGSKAAKHALICLFRLPSKHVEKGRVAVLWLVTNLSPPLVTKTSVNAVWTIYVSYSGMRCVAITAASFKKMLMLKANEKDHMHCLGCCALHGYMCRIRQTALICYSSINNFTF